MSRKCCNTGCHGCKDYEYYVEPEHQEADNSDVPIIGTLYSQENSEAAKIKEEAEKEYNRLLSHLNGSHKKSDKNKTICS